MISELSVIIMENGCEFVGLDNWVMAADRGIGLAWGSWLSAGISHGLDV